MMSRLWRSAREWRFLRLSLLLAGWMLLAPLLHDRWIVQLLLQLFLLNGVLVALWANPGWQQQRTVVFALWGLSLAASLSSLLPIGTDWQQRAFLLEIAVTMPLLALIAIGSLRHVFRGPQLTADGLFATVAVYVIVAILFAQAYLLLIAWDPGSFNISGAAERPLDQLRGDTMYFSLVTLATLGYGDVLPVSPTARAFATLEAVVGQFYVAIIVAVFVGMYANQRRNG